MKVDFWEWLVLISLFMLIGEFWAVIVFTIAVVLASG